MLIDPFIISGSSPEFKMTVDTTNAGTTPADGFKITLHNGATNFTVYWGDGTDDVITSYNQAELTHTYPAPGTYQISIDGSFHGLKFAYVDNLKLMSIDNWGTNVWGTMDQSFFTCTNLTGTYTDAPDTSAVTTMYKAFSYCPNFNSPLEIDTSSVNDMRYMFHASTSFNQPLIFDTSSVTRFDGMFQQATSFNQTINFDGTVLTNAFAMFAITSSMNSPVTITNSTLLQNTSNMFSQCPAFNSDIELTTTSCTNMSGMFSYSALFNGIITFNGGTGAVTNMSSMFLGDSDFNQPLTFLNDTSSVTTMRSMFRSAALFNQSVSAFNTSNVTDMVEMFRDCWVFNQPVPFDTSKLTSMYAMFFSCFALDQAINFNTTLVTNMQYMFVNCGQLNSSITFNDTSKVTTMLGMFQGCASFDQDVSSFDITLLTTASGMFNYANSWSQANYDLMLVAWNAFGTSSVPFHAGTAEYGASGADTARAAMISRGWTITDGGPGVLTNINSLIFDGTDDYIDFGTTATYTDVTISFWMKRNVSSGNKSLFNGTGFFQWLQFEHFQNYISYNGGSWVVFSGDVNDGTWKHITLINDTSSGEVRSYVNGVLDTTLSSYDATSVLYQFGNYNASSHFMNGGFDELSIFDSVLSAGDITTLYNSGTPNNLNGVLASTPVHWWRNGDGDTYPTIIDHGSGGNDGTMTNMTSGDIVSDVP